MRSLGALSPTITQSWLATQCQIIPGVVCAAVFSIATGHEEYPLPMACWPDSGEGVAAGLRVAAARAIAQSKPVVCCQPQAADVTAAAALHIACPILIDGNIEGVIAVEIEGSDEQRQRAIMQMLQWGSLWLQFTLQQAADTDMAPAPVVSDRSQQLLQIVAAALENSQLQAAATACATELASSLQYERVCIGLVKRKKLVLRSMSNSANFDAQTNLARAVELTMTEALEQEATLCYPSAADARSQIVSAATQLCRQHNTGSVCTVPLSCDGRLIGAISFERTSEQPFDSENVVYFEVVAALLGPVLELKCELEKHPLSQLWSSAKSFVGKLLGPSHPLLKLGVGTMAIVVALLSLLSGDYRTSGNAVLEGSIQRVVVAPMDGYIKTANVRPGDIVSKGQILGSLEDQDLRLERLRWSGQHAQLQKQYQEALGNRERTQVGILNAQIEQADAQLQLLNEQLARTEFAAPFDGVIVSGDLHQELGSPVERGRVLFTVAPLNSYRVVVQVDEQDIFELAEGQTGLLVLSALPGELMPVTVEKITPVSTPQDGRNYFRVEASLEASPQSLRPGMQGIAKIDIEQRKLIWIWTHSLTAWLRMWTWSWMG